MKAIQVFYEGRVQGVGFRYTVKHISSGFDVVGWVRNLVDGRVELRAQGDPEELSAFLDAVRESELNSYIKHEQKHPIAVSGDLKGFEIRF